MSIDKDTCWYDEDITPEMMAKASKGAFWPTLENSDHWPVLNKLIRIADLPAGSLLADVGCGMGDLCKLVTPHFMYSGYDLPHIVEKAQEMNHTGYFEAFDIYKDSCPFNFYNLIITNAFIDVLEEPFTALDKLLKCEAEYVIIHRQTVTQGKTHLTEHNSYGGRTYQSVLNVDELSEAIQQNNYELAHKEIVYQNENPHVSFLLKGV